MYDCIGFSNTMFCWCGSLSFVKIESIITKRRYLFFAVWLVAALITPPDI